MVICLIDSSDARRSTSSLTNVVQEFIPPAISWFRQSLRSLDPNGGNLPGRDDMKIFGSASVSVITGRLAHSVELLVNHPTPS
jgi:hypothetical protein